MECKKCSKEFKPRKGLKNYCSLQCRNSRTWTEKDKQKKSLAAKKSKKVISNSLKQLKKLKTYEEWKETRKETFQKKLFNTDFDTLSRTDKRRRVLLEQESKCNSCQISEWQGQKLTLELEHKDGNTQNNSRENLECLCPNCHSLTSTWRGRKNKKKEKITDKDLVKAILSSTSIRQALISLGLAPKGGNYKRCHRLLRELTSQNIAGDVRDS